MITFFWINNNKIEKGPRDRPSKTPLSLRCRPVMASSLRY